MNGSNLTQVGATESGTRTIPVCPVSCTLTPRRLPYTRAVTPRTHPCGRPDNLSGAGRPPSFLLCQAARCRARARGLAAANRCRTLTGGHPLLLTTGVVVHTWRPDRIRKEGGH